MAFPPIPVYPLAIDSNKTLFLVYNTSEAQLTADNLPWSQEVLLQPVAADQQEIWADNGFANLSGELFYYDAVDKDVNGKVYKLKRCTRNLDGLQTQLNKAGTWCRGFVIAEHHNQIVQATLNIEEFVGVNFSEDISTLDWRIRHLNAEPIGDDDFQCPDVTLNFQVISASTDGGTGTIISYDLIINGFFKTFLLDFGDGNFTSSAQSGTHTYAPTALIDPVVTVTNDNCQVVQTAIARTNPEEPTVAAPPTTFEINVPEPNIPTIVIPTITIPSVTLTLPQIQFPCELAIGPIGPIGDIPSMILLEPPIPSIIEVVGMVDFPSTITVIGGLDFPSTITVSGTVNFPSVVVFGPAPNIPSFIDFGPVSIPSIITFGPAPTFSTISFGPVNVPSSIPVVFPPNATISVTGLTINVPSIITVIDNIPSTITLTGSIPSTIRITGNPNIPSLINFGPAPSFSPIRFGPAPSISPIRFGSAPSISPIQFGPAPSISPIQFGPAPSISPIHFGPAPSISPIQFGPAPSISPIQFGPPPQLGPVQFGPAPTISVNWGNAPGISVTWGNPPQIGVNWGSPPTVTCNVNVSCPSAAPMRAAESAMAYSSPDFVDPFTNGLDMNIDTQDIGIPSEIKIIAPKIPDMHIKHDLPSVINIAVPVFPDIKIVGPDIPIPSEIRVYADTVIPSQIEVIGEIPSFLTLDASQVPSFIAIQVPDKFPAIQIEGDIPKTIQVVGIPSAIELKGSIPSEIDVNFKMPENLEIPLVFKGGPIPVKFESLTPGDSEDRPCFALVPCGKQ